MLRFEPALLPVEPDVGVADVMYGFTERVDLAKLGKKMFPVVIDTPFNVLQVSPIVSVNVCCAICHH